MRGLWMKYGVVAALLLFAVPAFASGFFVARFGGEHGHPTTDHLSSIYYNPAGLSLGSGTRLTIDANLAWRTFSYDRSVEALDNILEAGQSGAGTPQDAVSANSGKATLNNFIAALPRSRVILVLRVSPRLWVLCTFRWFVRLRSDRKPCRHPLLMTTALVAIEGTIRSVYFTVRQPIELNHLNCPLVWASMQLRAKPTVRARNSDGTDNVSVEGRALLDVSGVELAMGVGLLWEPLEGLFLGGSWQSSPNFGESELSGTAQLALAGSAEAETPNVKYYQTMPDVWQFGLRWRMDPKNEFRLFGNYISWSKLEYQCALDTSAGGRCEPEGSPLILLLREWTDGYALRFGAFYRLSKGVEFFGGGGFDTNSVPDRTLEPALYDTDKFTLSLGMKLRLRDGKLLTDSDTDEGGLNLATTYTQVIYVPRDIKPRGPNADGTKSDIEQFGFKAAQRQPDAAGSYEQLIGVLNINVEYTF